MDESVIKLFLKPPALPYVREIRRKLDQDQQYLKTEGANVSTKVRELLSQGGVFWDEEIFQREWEGTLKEAIIRLRSVEL